MPDLPPYSAFIAISRYARWKEEENRRETWQETVDRYIGHVRGHLSTNYNYSPTDPIFDEVRSAILALDVLPSMRGLMTAGPALEGNSMTIYNCSFLAVNDPRVFDEAMFILMSGTGAGYSVERKYVDQLPAVPDELVDVDEIIVVEDSKEGWARAFRTLISELYNGRILSLDTSQVRPMGARLKTFGGRASGPIPLQELFAATVDIFRNAAGRKLTPLECHDLMCRVGDIVVAGGSRRSALISLSDLESSEMARAKSGAWWEHYPFRALANNSVTYTSKPGTMEFLREWGNLIESQSGERGIFNLGGIRKHISSSGLGRDASKVAGTNPSLIAGTRVWTLDGVLPIDELEGKEFFVRTGSGALAEASCWKSGVDVPVSRILFSNGLSHVATPEHKWPVIQSDGSVVRRATSDLLPGDEVQVLTTGSVFPQGRMGTFQKGIVDAHNSDTELPPGVWDVNYSEQYRRGVLAGVFGRRTNGAIKIGSLNMARDVSDLLGFFGVQTETVLEDSYALVRLSAGVDKKSLDTLIDEASLAIFTTGTHSSVAVAAVEDAGKADVWDVAVNHPDHSFQLARVVTGNCGEISLRDMGLCNLTSVTLKEGDTLKDVRNKVRIASIIGTWQSTFTNFPYVRGEWKSNAEEERLLGVSLNGIYGHHLFNDPDDEKLPGRLEGLRAVAHDANLSESAKVGITRSVAVTTIKPEGTSSQLCMVSSGIHPWHSQYYIRSVRGSNYDPLTQLMKDAGVPNEPDVMKPDVNTVFYFPIAAPKGGVTRDRVDAMSHLRLYSAYRKHWADHQVSITVNVADDEWIRVGAWVYDNWDDVAGISFLPKFEDDTSYSQLPYQTCTREEYEDMVARMPSDIRFQDLMFYETEDGTTGSQTLACTAGGCEVIDLVSDEGGDRGE